MLYLLCRTVEVLDPLPNITRSQALSLLKEAQRVARSLLPLELNVTKRLARPQILYIQAVHDQFAMRKPAISIQSISLARKGLESPVQVHQYIRKLILRHDEVNRVKFPVVG